ncbi:hypothetical protein, partial [Burkholderia thailandensis]|uniref:hypothetical protein n=1 Tax=Burkholderia thailandensis TaxID=57975 RepID=UPI00016A79CC
PRAPDMRDRPAGRLGQCGTAWRGMGATIFRALAFAREFAVASSDGRLARAAPPLLSPDPK